MLERQLVVEEAILVGVKNELKTGDFLFNFWMLLLALLYIFWNGNKVVWSRWLKVVGLCE